MTSVVGGPMAAGAAGIAQSSLGNDRSMLHHHGAQSSPIYQALTNLMERVVNGVIHLEFKEPIREWKNVVLLVFLQIYIFICGWMLPTITLSRTVDGVLMTSTTQATSGDAISLIQTFQYSNSSLPIYYGYGYYGSWLFNILTFPITLSLDRISYYGMVGLSFACIAFIMIHMTGLLIAYRSIVLSTRYLQKIKSMVHYLSAVLIVLSAVMTFIMTSFIDCNYNKGTLTRFPGDISCFSGENIAYIVVCFIAIVALWICLLFSQLVLPNNHPKSRTFFIAQNSYFTSYFWLSVSFEMVTIFIIPVTVPFARAIVHLVIALIHLPIFFICIPFFRRAENSCYFAFLCGKFGMAVGSLISSLVNVQNYWDVGLGMMGLTFGISIVFGCLGFMAMEAYTRIVYKNTKEIIAELDLSDQKDAEKEALMQYQYFEDTKKLKQLEMFLRFSIFLQAGEEHWSDVDFALMFIKSLINNKSFSSARILIVSSIIVAYCWEREANSSTLALRILKSALKQNLSLLDRVSVLERIKQIEEFTERESSHSLRKNISELKAILLKLDKYQSELWGHHKGFWKELMADIVDLEKLEQISTRIASVTFECHRTFENLMSSYGNEKTLLRKFASFVENFKFDSELAQQLYVEAATIEEEESRTRKIEKNKMPHSLSTNSIEYTQLGKENHARDTLSDTPTDTMDTDQKKENLFKSAINIQEQHKVQKFGVVAFVVYSFLLLVSFIVVSAVLSVLPSSEIFAVRDSCQPKGTTSSIISEVRTAQVFLNFFGQTGGNVSSPLLTSVGIFNIDSYLQSFKTRINSRFEHLERLRDSSESKATSNAYVDSNYLLHVPSLNQSKGISVKSSLPRYTNIISRTSSVFDLTHQLLKNKQVLTSFSKSDLEKTLENFSIMYLLKNRDSAEDMFSNFCQQVAVKAIQDAKSYIDGFLGLFISSVTLYFSLGGAFFIYTFLELQKGKKLLNMMEHDIPDQTVSKIYSQICKKNEEEISMKNSGSLFQPKRVVLIIGVLFLVMTSICLSLIFVYAITNNNLSVSTIENLQRVTNTHSLIERAKYTIGELFIFRKTNGTSFVNDPDILDDNFVANLYTNVKTSLQDLLNEWNLAMLGINANSYTEILALVSESTSCNNSTASPTCQGLSSLISDFVVSAQELSEKLQSKNYQYNSLALFDSFLSVFFRSITLFSKIDEVENRFITLSSTPNVTLLVIFSVIGVLQCLVFSYLLYESFISTWRNIHQIRLMLHYVPWEILDSNDKFKNFILYHDLSANMQNGVSKRSRFLSAKKFSKKKSNKGDEDRVRSMLHSQPDGAILCNQAGDIEIFNPAAQKIFYHKPHEIVGLSVFTLFEPTANSKIKQVMENMSNALLENINNKNAEPLQGETMDVDCFRKNQSKFPGRISFFCTLFGRTPVVMFFVKDITAEKKQNMLLVEEKKKSESLLLNILPEAVAMRLKTGENLIAEKFNDATAFFSDMVGFTKMSSRMEAIEIIRMLSIVVNGFDELTDKYNLEKIKTIGDAYFCVGGLHNNSQKDHPERVLKFAIDVFSVLHHYNAEMIRDEHEKNIKKYDENGEEISVESRQINIRVGIHTGPAVAGVIGKKKFAYDLWGDTINVASRMESSSIEGRIQLSKSSYERVSGHGYRFEERLLDIKGKGICQTYLLNERLHKQAKLDSEAIKKLFEYEDDTLEQKLEDPFSEIDLHRADSYRFGKIILDTSFLNCFKEFLSGPKLEILNFYQHVLEFKSNGSTPVRYSIAKHLVDEYLAENASKRLQFKFMKNAFGPFQLKFNACNEDNCATDLFDNFVNLSIRALKPEFPKFLKSSIFSTFIENLKLTDPILLKSLLKGTKGEEGSHLTSEDDEYDSEEEKEFLLFCEKCGTEIINLENNRFNDWEFNYRLESLNDYNQWRILNEYPEGKTWLSPEVAHNHLTNSRRHTMIKYVYEVNCSYESLFNLWIDSDYYRCRDENIESFELIDFVKVGKYAHCIAHEVYKMKFPQTDREIVHAYCCRFDRAEKRYLCVSRSINHAKVPESSKYVRAEIKTAFMVQYLTDQTCRYTYTVIFDPMGWLNAEHHFNTIKDNGDTYHQHLLSLLHDRETKKNHARPTLGGLVDSLNHYLEYMETKHQRPPPQKQ